VQLSWCVDLVQEAARCGTDLPPHAAVTACAHAPDLEAVFIALSTGELLLLRPSAPSLPAVAVEEVGRVAGGVAAEAWSPDGEVLAVVGCAGQLLLMSSGWELLSEGPVACNAPAFPQPTAGPGPAAGEGEGGAPALVPGEVAVSWRGDAKFFATATVDGFGAAPRVRVWDGASGELHALGEAAEGLQAVLGWQPNGRHLYAAQFLPRAAAAEAAPAAADADGDGDAGGATQDQAAQQPRGAQGQAPEVRHVGAWKRELRRQRAAAAAAGAGAAPARVLLFERNGLQHGGFDVAGQGGAVQALHWSPDSELLAAVLVHPAAAVAAGAGGCDGGPPASQRTLQLWHRSNWRWYLAYERRFVDCAGLHVCWDEGGGGSGGGGGGGLHIVTAEGGYSHARLARAACVSALGTAAVVDGASVLLTPLRLAVTPPPMAAAALALPAPAACLALRDAGGGGDGGSGDEAVAAVLSDGRLAVLRCCEGDLWEETLEEQLEQAAWAGAGPPRLLPRVLGRRGAGAAAAARQAAWASPTSLLLVEPSEGGDRLVEVEVFAGGEAGPAECAGAGADVAAEVWAAPAPGPVVRCVSRAEAPGAVVQVAGGALWVYHPGGRLEPAAERLPCACPLMAATPAAARRADSAAPEAFGLDPRGRLFWGAAQVAAGVTSFALLHHAAGGPFLLYTSRDHTLRTLPLAALRGGRAAPRPAPAAPAPWQQQPGAGPPPPPPPGDISVRPVEEGSLLVAAPSGGIDVICQAPRGNLESVRPRALALPALAAELDAGRFAAAWALAAANRLDLNVLVDHRWPRFLTQASQFAREVGSDLALAELLAALTPGSTAAEGGIYAGALPSGPAHTHTHSGAAGAGGAPADGHSEVLAWRAGGAPAAAAPAAAAPAAAEAAAAKAAAAEAAAAQGKVEAVCAAVRAAAEALEAEDPSAGRRWFRARLTSLSRCGDLEGALRLVQAAKEADLAAGGGGGGGAAAGAAGTGGAAGGGPTAEEGLRHLLLHAPEEGVYRAALGSYCLELAYMVVAHSQVGGGVVGWRLGCGCRGRVVAASTGPGGLLRVGLGLRSLRVRPPPPAHHPPRRPARPLRSRATCASAHAPTRPRTPAPRSATRASIFWSCSASRPSPAPTSAPTPSTPTWAATPRRCATSRRPAPRTSPPRWRTRGGTACSARCWRSPRAPTAPMTARGCTPPAGRSWRAGPSTRTRRSRSWRRATASARCGPTASPACGAPRWRWPLGWGGRPTASPPWPPGWRPTWRTPTSRRTPRR
jgi:elongator complex protein 1